MVFKRLVAIFVFATFTASAQVIYFDHSESGFFAIGNWASADASVKAPPSETKIDCFRKSRSCVEATAEYYMGHPPRERQLFGCHQVGWGWNYRQRFKRGLYDSHDADYLCGETNVLKSLHETA